jgi:hypothetical protein
MVSIQTIPSTGTWHVGGLISMTKTLTIATAHSKNATKYDSKIEIQLEGNNPWFGRMWINNKMYLIGIDKNNRIEITR